MEDIRVLAFFYIIQAALMGFVGMGLLGISLRWKQIIWIGLIQGVVVYLSRGISYGILQLPYGLHSLICFCSFIIILYFTVRKEWGISLAATSIAFIIVMLSEGIIVPLYYHYSPVESIQQLHTNIWLHIKYSYFSDWLLLLMAVYLILFKKPFINIEAKKQKV